VDLVIAEIIITIILFILGVFSVRRYAIKKLGNDSFIRSFILNLSWIIPEVLLYIVFLYFFRQNFLVDIIRVGINILIGIIITVKIYNITVKESSIFVVVINAILYGSTFIASRIPSIIEIYQIPLRVYDGSKLTFPFVLLILFSALNFLVSWGDKIQLVENKRLISVLSILPGICILIHSFSEQNRYFYLNLSSNLILAFIVSIIAIIVLKNLAFRVINYGEFRELNVLEKDKILLRVKNLKIHYPLIGGMLKRQIGAVKAVDDVSFRVKTGETLGLVGESGCGKTSIAKAILSLVEKTDGEIIFQDEPIPEGYSRYIRQKIQFVFQDPDASLNPRFKVVDIIAEPLKNLMGITEKEQIRRTVLKLLKQVSLKREHMDRYPHEFSGGQKQRIIIARALACNPELIILDEPTSALDVSVQAQILNLLKDLQDEYGYGFLFITHNLAVVNHIADRVAVMYLGKFVEVGETEQIFSNPTHPYTRALLASRSEIDPYKQEISFVIKGEVPSPISPPKGCTFNPRCSSETRTKECELELPHKIKIEEGHFIWCVNPPSLKEQINER
jgi:oligopeptide/dipeptide ABC transporter ATP-binding protein